MNRAAPNATERLFVTDHSEAKSEIVFLARQVASGVDTAAFEGLFRDTKALFAGAYPGYRASNTKYHDFDHTLSVVLATARLIHGSALEGHRFSASQVLLTLIAALFHDVGLIQRIDDTEGSGAKYTVGHEERSVLFTRNYLSEKGYAAQDIETCGDFIRCTILSYQPNQIVFASGTLKTLGYIVGSADLLAQMADRLYLEKLLLLFKEFEEARLPGFDSELDLLQKTKDFYEIVAKKRFHDELEGVCIHMRAHFRARYGRDVDGYAEAIENNILYLDTLIGLCQDSFPCYLKHLKRGGIAQPLLAALSAEDDR